MKTHDFILSGCDTDSIMFCKADQKKFTEEEQKELLKEINDILPKMIKMEHDGYYKSVIYLKAKNYVLNDSKKLTIKGSALKNPNKEPALREFMDKVVGLMLKGRLDHIYDLYCDYAKEAMNVTDISRWVTKKTITDKVLNPERTNEEKVKQAIDGKYVQEGDKIWVFFKSDKSLCLQENFDGDYCKETLLGKLHSTLKVFQTLIDIKVFPNFKTGRNKPLLEKLLA
jgi:DNA polymerase elongation subunit (family B)